jgi:hypothetical protein
MKRAESDRSSHMPWEAALNNAIQGFGRLAPANTAFTKALEAGLIDENGKPVELQSLIDASSFEVNRRITAGTFN